MKTEKEFSEYFFNSCQHDPKTAEAIKKISESYWNDLTSHHYEYFSDEDRHAITKKSAETLSQFIKTQPVDDAWKNTIRSFITENQWGYKSISKKPQVAQTEDQKIFWTLFKYVWAFFQSMVILKIAVYYFGLESAERPDQISSVWVWLFFGLSAGSLALFAYRNRNDKT